MLAVLNWRSLYRPWRIYGALLTRGWCLHRTPTRALYFGGVLHMRNDRPEWTSECALGVGCEHGRGSGPGGLATKAYSKGLAKGLEGLLRYRRVLSASPRRGPGRRHAARPRSGKTRHVKSPS